MYRYVRTLSTKFSNLEVDTAVHLMTRTKFNSSSKTGTYSTELNVIIWIKFSTAAV